MKNSIIVSIFILMDVHCAFAQVKIEDKYKIPGKTSLSVHPMKLQITLYANDGFEEPKSTYRGYGVRQCQQCYSTEPTVLGYDYGNFPSMGFTLGKEFISLNDAVSSIEIINN